MQNSNKTSKYLKGNLKRGRDDASSDLPKNKLIQSRNTWIERAKAGAKVSKTMQEQIRNLTESRDTWKAKALDIKTTLRDEIEMLKKENIKLKANLQKANTSLEDLKKKHK